ncbi:hypothetical protein D9M70_644720 [compost metagenome]
MALALGGALRLLKEDCMAGLPVCTTLLSSCLSDVDDTGDHAGDLIRQKRGNRVANLVELLGSVPQKEIVVREGL